MNYQNHKLCDIYNNMFLDNRKKKKLNEFCKFVVTELKILSPPRIIIQNGNMGLKTTANYDYTKPEKIIKVNGKGRMLADVMRSLAHELVHHKQWENGELKVKPPDIGGRIEDFANAKAGELIKLFAQKDITIYENTIRKTILDYIDNKDIDSEEIDIYEEDSASDGEPESGVSDNQSGGKGYPEVTTWEDVVGSKLTRGPANQIKTTKWSDIVGSVLTRGPANQLK